MISASASSRKLPTPFAVGAASLKKRELFRVHMQWLIRSNQPLLYEVEVTRSY